MLVVVLISHDRRFIFVHVSKAAGTSIQQALAPYASARPAWSARMLAGMRGRWCVPGRVFREHATAATIRQGLSAGRYGEYFSFAFVRNPWDWMVSLYAYLLNTPSHRHHARVKAMSGLREYIEFEVSRGKRSQHEFLTDGAGRVIVDYVGRYEFLQHHFSAVCRRLRLEAVLPHVNGSKHRDYRAMYDSATIDLVARHFSDDIELLGYDFDGPCGEISPCIPSRAVTRSPAVAAMAMS